MEAAVQDEIARLLRAGYGPLKVSRDLASVGVSLADVLRVQHPVVNVIGIAPTLRGPRHLQKYIIAIKGVFDNWPPVYAEALQKAREDYDDGLIEMCQGRDGAWIIQYAIPRKVKARARAGFELR